MFQNKNHGQLSSKVQFLVILAWVLNTYSSLFVFLPQIQCNESFGESGGGGMVRGCWTKDE